MAGQGSGLVVGLCALCLLAAAPARAALAAEAVLLEADALHAPIEGVIARNRPRLLRREQLIAEPELDAVQLSPRGDAVLYSRLDQGRRGLWRLDLSTRQQRRIALDARGVRAYWSGDGERVWLVDADGVSVLEDDSASARRVLSFDPDRDQRFWGVDSRAAEWALLHEQLKHTEGVTHRYLRVDASGETHELLRSRLPVRSVLLDASGVLRFSAAFEGPDYDTVIRRHQNGRAEDLLRCMGVETCSLFDFRDEGARLLVRSQHGLDREALLEWKAEVGNWERVHEHPGPGELEQVLWPQQAQHWIGLRYAHDEGRWHGRSERDSGALKTLQAQLAQARLDLDSSADGSVWLVRAWHARWREDRHYLFRPDTGELKSLLEADTGIATPEPAHLVDALRVHYQASDGRRLHGYLWLPAGRASNEAPLLALIHGGPFNHDRDGYDPLAQLLANRGIAVFKPNFRGSTGYGLDYRRAAGDDFGNGRVLADVVEGLDALLAAGIGDLRQQSVAGHSFGGYASLLAVTHHPGRFRFAVATAAPVDFGWSMRWIADNGGSALPENGPPPALLLKQYGLPALDEHWRERMRQDSPLEAAHRLAAPVYLWAGAEDDRVPLASLVRYSTAVRSGERGLSFLIDPKAGHAPVDPAGMQALLYLHEIAAARAFSTPLQPPSPELSDFLDRNLKLDAAAEANDSNR